jgi:DnaJ-class molecular chaperone
MSHTKDLTDCQNDFFKIGMGNREDKKITLCVDCKGAGGLMTNDRLGPVCICTTCNGTGRRE